MENFTLPQNEVRDGQGRVALISASLILKLFTENL